MSWHEEIIKKSFKDEPNRVNGINPNILYGTSGAMTHGEEYFRKMWFDTHSHNQQEKYIIGCDPYKKEDMKITQFNRNFDRFTYPNTKFLKEVFPIQNEEIRDFEPHDENFELELKKFFAFGRRRTGRSKMLARVLVETAIESGREIEIVDHYIDKRGANDAIHHTQRYMMDIIHEYKHKGVYIEIVKQTRDTIQLFLDPRYFNDYNRIKIENNPTKIEYYSNSKPRLEKLNRRRLLLI